ncbi:MAG: heavy metal translocating P-type ATPase [Flavobacterium sp. BFFFF2]|nr:MAG: heavy metal translocating P-type ATPase [Flavobacterium sp. BFFFF2]
MSTSMCFHCGNDVPHGTNFQADAHLFCCLGCKTVYELFTQNNLSSYYDFQNNPGASPIADSAKFDYLDQLAIQSQLLDFEDENMHIVSLYVPHIHCSSCIWILENLQKLESGIIKAQVHFTSKKVRIHFDPKKVSLRKLAELLARIGYEPYISLAEMTEKPKTVDRVLLYKLAIAFFCFGNIMLLSFPEYFEWNEYWINRYRPFLRGLIFVISLPSFLYSASGYYESAWKSIKSKLLNIEIPIALGIIVMFVRSVVDMWWEHGPGFFDSMTGLIFFMLLGKLFQQKTYDFLSFERDYKSYFPVAVTRINGQGVEIPVPIQEVNRGDRLLIRNQELIPADGILISDRAGIDYSFVTGEAQTVEKYSGDKIFAGGKHLGKGFQMEVLQPVSHSYLTRLWGNDVFDGSKSEKYVTITNTVSRYFTPALLILSVVSFILWSFKDVSAAFEVFTAILIVACPCALALTAPFTLGNVIRLMGQKAFYVKNTAVIEQLSRIDTLVFDKTGTLTSAQKTNMTIQYDLTENQTFQLKTLLRASNHPLSRQIYDALPFGAEYDVAKFEEVSGKGISGIIEGQIFKVGSAAWVGFPEQLREGITAVHVSIDHSYKGVAEMANAYRPGLEQLFERLQKKYSLHILSGDNDGERTALEALLPQNIPMHFNQKPEDKLNFIKQLQVQGKKVLMIGDGLNDAGALMQSEVGVALAEDVNVFSPACDAILDARELKHFDFYLNYAHHARLTIYISFIISLLYNIVGLSFAISHQLDPVVAAIIMPLSTITIVSVVTILSSYFAKRYHKY